MITWHLREVMDAKSIDYKELARRTGMNAKVCSRLSTHPPKSLNRETCNALCKALDCQPGDLQRYVPD